MNRGILIGNLANDPESRTTQSGIAQCSFRLAVQRRFKGANGERETDFLPVVCWRQTAEFAQRYLAKGRKVAVEGSIQTRSYDAQDGSKRYVTEVVGSDIEFMGSKVQRENSADSAFAASQPGLGASQPVPQGPGSFGAPVAEDDIPF